MMIASTCIVPYEKPNLAVEQLSVNESGDVGVDGALSMKGKTRTQQALIVDSDGATSHLYIHVYDDGHMLVSATGGIDLNAGYKMVTINSRAK